MVKIRLSLKGKKGQRSFWIIAIDERKARDSGSYLEYLGFYNPHSKEIKLDKENINKWLWYTTGKNYSYSARHTLGTTFR